MKNIGNINHRKILKSFINIAKNLKKIAAKSNHAKIADDLRKEFSEDAYDALYSFNESVEYINSVMYDPEYREIMSDIFDNSPNEYKRFSKILDSGYPTEHAPLYDFATEQVAKYMEKCWEDDEFNPEKLD